MTAVAWPGTNDVIGGSSRCSIWSITWMCCRGSRGAGRIAAAGTADGGPVCGRRASIEIWQALIERHGKQSGTRQMIDLLKLRQTAWSWPVASGDRNGAGHRLHDAAAVQHLLNAAGSEPYAVRGHRYRALERYQRPLPVMNEYDQLLTAGGAR